MRNKLLAGAMALALIGCSEKSSDDASISGPANSESPAAAEEAAEAAPAEEAKV